MASIDVAYRGVPALVLGATGFIGAWMVRALHARGAIVTATARDATRADAVLGAPVSGIRVVIADLSDRGAAGAIIDRARPAVVFNLAGYGVDRSERDPALMSALNAQLVDELCASLAGERDEWTGLRLVHVGSALEYGRVDRELAESVDVNPTTEYGRTKLQGTRSVEDACANRGLHAVVARLFTVYGLGEHDGRLLPALMRTARTGMRLSLTTGRQRRDFTYVEDAVEGLLRFGANRASSGQIVNLATGRLSTVREFAETAASVLAFDPALLDFGALADRDDEMWHDDVDVTRCRDLISWTPSTTIVEGIRRSWDLVDVG